jgi:hypothetical protein
MKIGLDEMVVTVGMRSALALEAKRAEKDWEAGRGKAEGITR